MEGPYDEARWNVLRLSCVVKHAKPTGQPPQQVAVRQSLFRVMLDPNVGS